MLVASSTNDREAGSPAVVLFSQAVDVGLEVDYWDAPAASDLHARERAVVNELLHASAAKR
jgi:hypothetical protein